MAVNDIYTDGIASGWKVIDASTYTSNQTLEADVVIVGTGAGGGTAAEILSARGLKVLMLEEGPLKTSASFKDMNESRAYRELYQESGARSTSDGAVAILQGRSVGGTTTVNWTSSFRTPTPTLEYWAKNFGVKESSEAEMAPWFAKAEERLGIAPWGMEPNANNAALRTACQKLGWEWHVIPRNVRGCWNSGYCGFGCPANAKQSMLVSTIPAALKNGAVLVHHLSVRTLSFAGDQVTGLNAIALDANTIHPTGVSVSIKARHVVLAGGALNTPALLLRSKAPDPHQRVGKRTMLHPVNLTVAQMPEKIDPYYGAPQSIASDHFQWQNGDFNQAPGFKLEVPPMPPGLSASIFMRFGAELARDAALLPYTQAMLALTRDGFHEQYAGGTVRLGEGGVPVLDYDFSDYAWRGFKNSFLRMAEAQFAAGAIKVLPGHLNAEWCSNMAAAKSHIEALAYKKQMVSIFTAHQMGGCAMGEDAAMSVIKSDGSHHQLANLSIFDGSMFPTSIGANPQLSIYGHVTRNATRLGERLKPA